ncbi:hypothetical protein KFS98_003601 [Salmonella enterica]|nr:hypothetical protein [Salmonella enterica]
MNKAKYDLDSLSNEELEGMVKVGKMAEYILSHREVDRAERLQNNSRFQRVKRSFEVQYNDCPLHVLELRFSAFNTNFQVIAWQEASGEFEVSVLRASDIRHGDSIESIYNNNYSSLSDSPKFREKIEELYNKIFTQKGPQKYINLGVIDGEELFAMSDEEIARCAKLNLR